MEGDTAASLYVIDPTTGALRQAGAVNGLATLGSDGALTSSQIPPSIANGMTFQATWNAATNTPTLPPVSTPDPGDFWIVTVAGSTALPGAPGPWTVGQIAVYNGTNWSAVPYYALAVGLPVAGASAGYVLYVDSGGLLQTAAVGSTSGIQGWSAALAAIATNGTPTAWGLARMLDSGQSANRTALALVPGTDVQAYSSVLTTLVSNGAPGTEGLALLLADTAATARSTLGLGTLATQAANNVSISGGSITGITDLAVADGGTGASTPAAARDNVVWSGAGAIDPASPYTVAAGVDNVTFASSKTLAPRALSNYADGQIIRVTNSGASTITVTITPADGTIDGSSSVALTVLAHGVVGCQRVSASAWVSLQPGAVATTAFEIRLTGGSWFAYPQGWTGSAWVDTGAGLALTVEAAGSYTTSGAKITIPSGTTNNTTPAVTSSYRAYIALSSLSIWATTFGRVYAVDVNCPFDSAVANARFGYALCFPTGAYDANAETLFSERQGYTGSQWTTQISQGTGTYSAAYLNTAFPTVSRVVFQPALANGIYTVDGTASAGNSVTIPTTLPTHLYVLGGAATGSTGSAATCTPSIRLILLTGGP